MRDIPKMKEIEAIKKDCDSVGHMVFNAKYYNYMYEHCNLNCELCELSKPIMDGKTTPCVLIQMTRNEATKYISKLYS